jgi:hypothetical protein
MGFNHKYVFFGLFALTESMPQQVKESPASAIFQKKRYRDRYRHIPLFKATIHGQFLGRTDLVSV